MTKTVAEREVSVSASDTAWRQRLAWLPCVIASLFFIAGAPRPAVAQSDVALRSHEGPLPGRSVADVEMDEFGFLWFATGGGLVRYDGVESRAYLFEHTDHTRSSPNVTSQLLREPGGHVWVSNSMGIARVDPASDSLLWIVGGPDALFGIESSVRQMELDRMGTVWFAVLGKSVCRWRPPAPLACYEHPPGAPDPEQLPSYLRPIDLDLVTGLEPDDNGGVWALFRNRMRHLDAEGRWSVPPGGDPLAELLGDRNPFEYIVRGLESDDRGGLWAGACGLGFLVRLDPLSGESVAYPPAEGFDACVNSILIDEPDRVWAGTDQGVYRLNLASGRRDVLDYFPVMTGGFRPINARGMTFDSHGNVWVSHRTGVAWIARVGGVAAGRPFRTLRYRPGWEHTIPQSEIWDAVPTGDGGFWLAFQTEGLGRTDRLDRQVRRWTADDGLASSALRRLATDDRGRVWIASASGLDLMDPETDRLLRISGTARLAGPEANGPGSTYMAQGSDGVIWLAGRSGVHRLRPAANAEGPHQLDLLVPTEGLGQIPLALLEDPEGLWIGLYRGGLARYDASTGELLTPEDLGTTELNQILEIEEDSAGRIWIASSTGLATLLPTADGWMLQRWNVDGFEAVAGGVRGVEVDDQGMVWAATRQEIVRFDPSLGTPSAIRRFGPVSGTQRNLPTRGIKSTEDGWLLVPSYDGLVAFHPDSMRPASEPPVVRITAVEIFNEPVPITPDGAGPLTVSPVLAEELRFTHDQSFFQIRWRALDYRDPARNRYAYRVPELDERWIDTGATGEAAFSNLTAGRYTLELAAADPDGLWNREGASIAIRVIPPWWASLWFRGLALVGIVAALWYGYALRTQAQLAVAKAAPLPAPDQERRITRAKKTVIYLGTVSVLMQVFSAAHEVISGVFTSTLHFPGVFSGVLASAVTASVMGPVRNSLRRWVGLE